MTAGYGINVIVTQMDFNLFETTLLSARILDKTYNMEIGGNIIFSGVCTILLSFLIAFITEKFTVKKAKKYRVDEMIEDLPLTKREKRGKNTPKKRGNSCDLRYARRNSRGRGNSQTAIYRL